MADTQIQVSSAAQHDRPAHKTHFDPTDGFDFIAVLRPSGLI